MKKQNNFYVLFILVVVFAVNACKKDNNAATTNDDTSSSLILADFPTYVAEPNLNDLKQKAFSFSQASSSFLASPSQDGLIAMQQQWYATRVAWEQSEAFLFGPVATLGLDPAIDSWPVNFVDIDSVISQNSSFSDSFIDSLETSLKGFHPIEYLIFGNNGSRQYTELTQKQKDYLQALTSHLKRVTEQMHNEWKVTGENFSAQIANAGGQGSQYASKQEAILEIINAMAGIVDEVGNGKIAEPFLAKDPSLEESPFAKNSFTDFKNNIIGVQNVYFGKYIAQGNGVQSIVQQFNKSLDLKITQKLQQCIDNLESYTVPFGEAINSQPGAIQSTQTLLNDLQTILEDELVPLIQQHVK